MKNKGWAWLCHHEVLLEWCDDYKGRVAYIRRNKPACEVPLRLEWFRLVKGKLPDEVIKALAAYDKAVAAYGKAEAAYGKAVAAYGKAEAAYGKALAAYGKAVAAYDKAWAAYDKAWAAYDKAWAARDKALDDCNKAGAAYKKAGAAYNKAWAARDKALDDHMPEIEKLYREECPGSPWNGTTLFPK